MVGQRRDTDSVVQIVQGYFALVKHIFLCPAMIPAERVYVFRRLPLRPASLFALTTRLRCHTSPARGACTSTEHSSAQEAHATPPSPEPGSASPSPASRTTPVTEGIPHLQSHPRARKGEPLPYMLSLEIGVGVANRILRLITKLPAGPGRVDETTIGILKVDSRLSYGNRREVAPHELQGWFPGSDLWPT